MNDTARGNHEKAQAVLQATKNGGKLAAQHHRLVELADHGVPLSPYQQKELDGIYVKLPEYTPPFVHGVEHMTIDQEGVLYYKGVAVDYGALAWTTTLGGRADVLRVQDQCRYLEAQGIRPTVQEIFFNWGAYDKAYFDEKEAQLAALVPEGTQILLSYIYARGVNNESVEFLLPGQAAAEDAVAHPIYQDTVGPGVAPLTVEVSVYRCGIGQPQPATQEQCDMISLAFFALWTRGILNEVSCIEHTFAPAEEPAEDYGEER